MCLCAVREAVLYACVCTCTKSVTVVLFIEVWVHVSDWVGRCEVSINACAHSSAVLRIKIGVQEITSIPCSSPNAMNQNSGFIKCIHTDIDPDEACFQHYLVHSLEPDTTLSTLVRYVYDRLRSKNLLGLVLVHHSDSMVLVDAFWDSDVPSNILLCIVSHRDGQLLLDMLQSQEPGEVSVTVDVESSVDVPGTTVMDNSSAGATEAEQSTSCILPCSTCCTHMRVYVLVYLGCPPNTYEGMIIVQDHE